MLDHEFREPRDPSRVLVLGSRGFVGSAIVGRLTARGIEVEPIASTDIDLTSPGATQALVGRLAPEDALVLVSALTPDRGRDIATMLANLTMGERVASALAAKPAAHVVYISSDAVYRDDANPVDERSCAEPASYHGMMHAARELMLKTAYKGPLAILRPSLLYGAADTHNGYGPNRFRRTAADQGRITLFGEGEEKRDHVHVEDVAAIVELALRHRSSGVLNVATGRSSSFMEVARHVAAQFERSIEIITTPRQNPITHRHFDPSDGLKAFPGFRYTPLEEGIARAHKAMMEGA